MLDTVPIHVRVAALDERISVLAEQRDLVIGKLNAFSRYEGFDQSMLVDGLLERLHDFEESIHDLVRQRDELIEPVWR